MTPFLYPTRIFSQRAFEPGSRFFELLEALASCADDSSETARLRLEWLQDERGSFDDTNKAEQLFALVSDALQSSTDWGQIPFLLGALERSYGDQGVISRDRSWYDWRKLRSFDWPRKEHPRLLASLFHIEPSKTHRTRYLKSATDSPEYSIVK